MAEGLNPIEQLIEIKFSTNKGMNPAEVAAAMETVRKQYGGLLKDVNKFTSALGDVDKATDGVVNGYKRQGKAAEIAQSGFKKVSTALKGAWASASKTAIIFDRLTTGMAGAIGSVLALTKVAVDLDQGLIKASAGANRLGIGIGDLEAKFKSISRQTSLTRQAVTGLFDAYQMDMRFASMEGFESMMKRIEKTVGPNEQAMGQMVGVITSLSGKFPELARQLQNVNDSNRDALEATIVRLRRQGDLTDAEDRTARAYIRGNEQMSESDRKIYDEKMKQQEAMGKIKVAFEALAVAAGRVVLPAIISITEWIEKLADRTEGWENWIGKAVVAAIALKGALMAIRMVSTITSLAGFSVGAMGAGAMGAGAMGAAGAAGAAGKGLTMAGVVGKGVGAVKGGFGVIGGLAGGGAAVGAGIVTVLAGAIYGGAIMASEDFAEKQAKKPWMQKFIDMLPEDLFPTYGKIGKAADTTKLDIKAKKLREAGEIWDPHQKFGSMKEREKAWKGFKEQKKKMQEAPGYKSIKQKEEEIELEEELRKKKEEIIQANNVMIQKAELLANLYQAQSSHLSTMVENMAASGKIDLGTAFSKAAAGMATLKAEQEELLKIQALYANPDLEGKDMSKVDLEANAELVKSSKQISQETKDKVQLLQDSGKLTLTELSNLIKLEGVGEKIESNQLKQKQHYLGMIKLHDVRLKSLSLEVDRSNKLIQIADNYAIGIGASAQMRMDLYDAEGQRIKELRLQLITNAEAMAEGGNSAERNLLLANQRKEIENEILDATLSQNQAVKAMRDGWVSAISAMHTGAGGFSEIIMDATQNTAQLQRLEGAVRTSFGGAFSRYRGEDVGFRRSERFGVGGIGSIRGRTGGRQLSYLTQADRRMGIGLEGPSVLQHRARGTGQRILQEMGTQGRVVRQGGGQALGAQHRMLVGSFVAGPGNVGTGLTNVGTVQKKIEENEVKQKEAKERVMLLGPSSKAAEKTTTIIPHAAATDITEPGAGAGVVNATVVMPNAQLNFTITNGQQLIDDGVEQMKEGIQGSVVDALNAG